MAAGGFTFAFARAIAKLFTSWSDTMPAHIAGVLSLFAIIRRTEIFAECGNASAHYLLFAQVMNGTGAARRQFIPKAARLSSRAALCRRNGFF